MVDRSRGSTGNHNGNCCAANLEKRKLREQQNSRHTLFKPPIKIPTILINTKFDAAGHFRCNHNNIILIILLMFALSSKNHLPTCSSIWVKVLFFLSRYSFTAYMIQMDLLITIHDDIFDLLIQCYTCQSVQIMSFKDG